MSYETMSRAEILEAEAGHLVETIERLRSELEGLRKTVSELRLSEGDAHEQLRVTRNELQYERGRIEQLLRQAFACGAATGHDGTVEGWFSDPDIHAAEWNVGEVLEG